MIRVFAVFFAVSMSCAPADEAAIDKAAREAIATPKIPGGSIRVVKSGEVIFDRAYGKSDAKATRDWRTNEIVKIASMTKPVTATLVAILVSEGQLSFSDPVAKYLPGFDNLTVKGTGVRSPTIAECLSHTAGFRGGTVKNLPRNSAVFTSGDSLAVAEEIRADGLVSAPGAKFAYTYRGFAVVAAVIEKTQDKPFHVALEEKLLKPLGMDETSFYPKEEWADRFPQFATLQPAPERLKQWVALQGKKWANPAGGLLSTSDDIARFYQLHINKGKAGDTQLVDPAVLQKMYQIQPGSKSYGIGFNIDREPSEGVRARIRHGGASGTLGWADLEKELIFVGFTQAGSANARPFLKAASDAVLEMGEN